MRRGVPPVPDREAVNVEGLNLPPEVAAWIGGAPVRDSSGCSGARVLYVERGGGAYLKIAKAGELAQESVMQAYFATLGVTAPVLFYTSGARDYLATAAVPGKDGVAPEHVAQPERLCEVFGRSLRRLHGLDASACPVQDRLGGLLEGAEAAAFDEGYLRSIAPHIGPARPQEAAEELARGARLLRNDALLHGDCCLPNIMLRDWAFTGFVDLAGGGRGDRHFDLVWGLWTIQHNLRDHVFGELFLDAYGRDAVDPARLRLCGLLAFRL